MKDIMPCDNPLVSVVIPCYNSIELHRTLKSVCNQSYVYWEVLCVDDGSDIDILPIIEAINDPRIFYYRLEEHSNANVARNYGINHAHGEYIAMLDSDDEWLDTHLESSISMLKKEDIDGIYGSLILRSKAADSVFTTRQVNEGESMIDFLLATGYGAQTSTLVMTASSVRNIKWDETLKRHQDYDFVVRYSRKYKMLPKIEATVVYHFSNTPKVIDFNSCIRFIHTVEDEIADRIYMDYHNHMLRLAISCNAQKDVITHYRREAARYAYLLSFYDFLMILQPQNRLKACMLKIKYIWRILLVSIE